MGTMIEKGVPKFLTVNTIKSGRVANSTPIIYKQDIYYLEYLY